MSVVEEVRAYIRAYPPLAGNKINVDFLPAEAQSYSLEIVPGASLVKTYMGGAEVHQLIFVLASRESYGGEVLQQLENLGFYEDFADWVGEQNRQKNFPALGEGKSVTKIEATTPGYALPTGDGKARYQIQCRMEYIKERSIWKQ